MYNVQCLWQGDNTLGESPLWDKRTQTLYWVDILGPKIHAFTPRTQHYRNWPMPTLVGCIALRKLGGLVVGLRDHLAFFDPQTEIVTPWVPIVEHDPRVRLNDGKCGPKGDLWVGTMDLEEAAPIADLYRVDQDGNVTSLIDRVTISNGLGWSPDRTIFYYTDSEIRTIYKFHYDKETQALSDRQIFAKIPEDAGFPDGLTVDSEGFVWGAHWGGWRITRYAPSGEIVDVIKLPVRRPTSCCFGGENHNILYITSARKGFTALELAENPLAGSVFAIETNTKGQHEFEFIG